MIFLFFFFSFVSCSLWSWTCHGWISIWSPVKTWICTLPYSTRTRDPCSRKWNDITISQRKETWKTFLLLESYRLLRKRVVLGPPVLKSLSASSGLGCLPLTIYALLILVLGITDIIEVCKYYHSVTWAGRWVGLAYPGVSQYQLSTPRPTPSSIYSICSMNVWLVYRPWYS